MSYDYLAESTGHVIGLNRGREIGYSEGHNDVIERWNAQVNNHWRPLVNRLQAERDQALRNNQECLKHNKEWQAHSAQLKAQIQELQKQLQAERENSNEWLNAFNSVGCALHSAAVVIDAAPQEMRDKVMDKYESLMSAWMGKGHINVIPHDQITWNNRLGPSCALYQNWWRDYQAKKAAAQAAANNSPNP